MQNKNLKQLLTISIILIFLTPLSVFGQKDKYEKRQEKMTKAIFDNCEQGKYHKYSGKINVEQTDDYVYYETDSIRIYLSYHFFIGFLSNNDTIAKQTFYTFQDIYGQLFERGFLTSKMFICELNDSCKYNDHNGWMIQEGDSLAPFNPDVFGYKGPLIKILNIEHKESLDTKTTRKFEIWATTSKMEDGWGGFPVFYLELTNHNADKKTELKEFISGASLTCFRYGYSQI